LHHIKLGSEGNKMFCNGRGMIHGAEEGVASHKS